jgi:hypothetical protein
LIFQDEIEVFHFLRRCLCCAHVRSSPLVLIPLIPLIPQDMCSRFGLVYFESSGLKAASSSKIVRYLASRLFCKCVPCCPSVTLECHPFRAELI